MPLSSLMRLFYFFYISEDKKDIPSRVCFIAFKERSSLEAALHLTNTLFIDRALIVSQSRYGEIFC